MGCLRLVSMIGMDEPTVLHPISIKIMKKLAIFASGGGSNAEKIIHHFNEKNNGAAVALIVSNRKDAGVLSIAKAHGIESIVVDKKSFFESEILLDELKFHEIDFIALAGFLWLIPEYLVRDFDHKMLNIHPALLPKFGGKGMFGHHVHEAVKAAGETESGPTIHWVTKNYDEGATVFQAKTAILPTDSAAEIARKVLILEHKHFPKVIEQAIFGQPIVG